MAKIQYLEFEIHLTDADRVKALQANPPGETSVQPGGQTAIVRAPAGAAVEFGNSDNGGVALPMISVVEPKPASGPYIVSKWFTVSNPDWSRNFPVDAATFVRKSGGWFGIAALFGNTTRFYWRGIFVYDAPQDEATGGGSGGARAPLALRRWIDPGFANMGSADGTPSMTAQYDFTRDAGRTPDMLGFAMRGANTVRVHTITEHTTGLLSTEGISWERMYIRLRKFGDGGRFWRARNTANNNAGIVLATTPTGQIAVYNSDAAGARTLLGTSAALVLNQFYKLDVVVRFAQPAYGGTIWLYLNGTQVLTATAPAGTGIGQQGFHQSSEIGPDAAGTTMELDISFWMNANPPQTNVAGVITPLFTGLDFANGSRAVCVRPNGLAVGGANWTGDFRTLAQFPPRDNLGDKWTSTTALAEIRVTTDTLLAIDNVPGSLGCVGAVICHHGHRGTLQGQFGYKLGAAARVVVTFGGVGCPNSLEGTGDGTRIYSTMMYAPAPAQAPTVPFPAFELHRIKGNDAVVAGTDHFMAVAELIGTFGDEDYGPTVDPTLRNPLPYLGPHNAPYPRTPWARVSSPPLSPVIIKAGTYVGNGTGQDLTFKTPVHFFWTRKIAGVATGGRWFSSLPGAGFGGAHTPQPWVIPDQGIDASFVSVAAGGPPTGVGALPDRSGQVATLVAANTTLLDGDEDHKRDLLGVIVRALNADNPGDGNNWGFLTKTERDPDFIPADIIVWKPTLDHIDVLTDTGATWINNGPITNPAWQWTAVAGEGSQETRTIIRIAGADPEVNQAAQTYQYIAFSDPGQRFMLNGAMVAVDANADSVTTRPLIDTRFLPTFLYLQDTRPGIDNVTLAAVRGPGHVNLEVTLLDNAGTIRSPALKAQLGALVLGNTFNFSTDAHVAYNAWRADDGSADPGIPKTVKIGTYTGDGAATRIINLTPVSGVRPLWALVVGHGQPGATRDPSHAGLNSTDLTGTLGNNGIRAGGIDAITVGASLNVAAVVYDYLIFMGDSVGNADGWSINGEFAPVEPDTAPGSQWGADAEPPVEVEAGDVGGDLPGTAGGGDDDIDTDLATVCVPFTKRIFNDALSRIGISKRVVNAATDTTEEANLCRQHYARAVEQTLRDFPWPFATRYANLTLISGSVLLPANRDWTYSYQRPIDCVFERRIAVIRSGAVDPTPPPFQLSFDDTLAVGRIFTNEADAQLEYTARPACTAGRGDPLFLDALTWRLAARIAGPLSRVADVIKICLDQYDAKIARAYEVIRPGNPGPRTDVDPNTLDTATGSQAANVAVANRALLRIGARTIANLGTEQSREAEAVRVLFEEELRSVLRDYSWAFATRYDAALVLVAGTTSVPVNDDWQYSYRVAADTVKVRHIVSVNRREFDAAPLMFRLGSDATGTLLFTDEIDPTIETTVRIPDAVLRSDALFRDAFAWRLAACLAPSLATVDPGETEQLGRGPQDRPRERKSTEAQLRDRAATSAWRMYYRAIAMAAAADANEQQPTQDHGDADWIRGRN